MRNVFQAEAVPETRRTHLPAAARWRGGASEWSSHGQPGIGTSGIPGGVYRWHPCPTRCHGFLSALLIASVALSAASCSERFETGGA